MFNTCKIFRKTKNECSRDQTHSILFNILDKYPNLWSNTLETHNLLLNCPKMLCKHCYLNIFKDDNHMYQYDFTINHYEPRHCSISCKVPCTQLFHTIYEKLFLICQHNLQLVNSHVFLEPERGAIHLNLPWTRNRNTDMRSLSMKYKPCLN